MISLPTPPALIKREGNKANFEIVKLYPGYGVTLGNVLRRILLSSLPGAAVTEVKIRNIDHEFTTIPGVMENIVDLLLNIKKLRFQMHGEGPYTLKLEAKGEKEITGGDLETPSQVVVVSDDQHIASLTDKKAELFMGFTVASGIGYLPVEMRKKEKLSVGTIAVDAIFTPIKNVNFSVENMRVGERTDYNKLTLEIETDGTMSPENALERAAIILTQQASVIAGLPLPELVDDKEAEPVAEKKTKSAKK